MAHHARALGKLVVVILKTRDRDDPRKSESAIHTTKGISPQGTSTATAGSVGRMVSVSNPYGACTLHGDNNF